jgi:maltose phosphorylase
MTKTPDRYLETHPWKIVEEGFHPERSRVSESLFSLGNEYQGVRGYFDEGYSGDGLRGCYLGGIFEEHILKEPLDYRGISSRIRFMVNTVDWLSIRLEVDGETLDLGRSRFSDFRRELDFSSGLLRRELVWHTQSGADLRVEFLRLLSMRTKELGMQRLSLTSLRGRAGISVTLGLDFSMLHESYRECFWECHRRSAEDRACAMLGVSRNVTQKLFAGFIPPSPAGGMTRYVEGDRFIGCRLEIELEKGRERIIDKACILAADRERTESEEKTWERGAMLLAEAGSFDQVRQDNAAYWKSIWDASDIVIEGDPEAQQGIRFCVFQLHQTCRGIMDSSNVGAKGLTGEAYNGHVFWDTETYCLPYYLFNNPRAAKSMLDFRHKTLPQAQERARARLRGRLFSGGHDRRKRELHAVAARESPAPAHHRRGVRDQPLCVRRGRFRFSPRQWRGAPGPDMQVPGEPCAEVAARRRVWLLRSHGPRRVSYDGEQQLLHQLHGETHVPLHAGGPAKHGADMPGKEVGGSGRLGMHGPGSVPLGGDRAAHDHSL